MFDTSFYNQGRGLQSGLRAGAEIGGAIRDITSGNAVQAAAQRIQAGENQQAVISELMARSPQAAQQLMNLLGGQQSLDAGAQEVEALKTKVGMQSLQQAALPIFGALQVDDDATRSKLLNEAAMVFEKQSPETAAIIKQVGSLQGRQQFDAVAGLVKSLRSAGVFPDDPSQLQQSTALGQNLSLYDQAVAAGDMERAELIKRNIDPYSRSFSSGVGAGQARVGTEQDLNQIFAQRKAAETQAIEGTATGQAQLQAAQLNAKKAETAVADEEVRKAKQLDLSRQTAELARQIASDPQLGAVTGLMAEAPTINPQSKDLVIKAQQLIALLTADNLKLMSGVLTDKDIEMLQTLSSGMKVDDKGIKGSQQAVSKRLTEIADSIEKTLAGKGAAASSQPVQRDEASILKEYGL